MNRQIGLPTYLDELQASHALFFGRSTLSDKKMESQFEGIDMQVVRDYGDRWLGEISAIHISDFPIFGQRLQYIHSRMTDWRHFYIKDLFYRDYQNPLAFYTIWFAITTIFLSLAIALASFIFDVVNGTKMNLKAQLLENIIFQLV